MKIDLDIETCSDWHKVEIFIKNGTCEYSAFDLLKADELEDLELTLNLMVQHIYDYRQKEGLIE